MAASPAIEVSALTKAYSETAGIFDVDLEVPAGTVMALLGPNGAGKTTTRAAVSDRPGDLGRLMRAPGDTGIQPADYQVRAPSLDDVYFALAGQDSSGHSSSGQGSTGLAAGPAEAAR